MTDINKLIEEEAKDRFSQKAFRGFTDIEKTIAITEFKYGGLFILSKWQDADRWRKFASDELPKIEQRIVCKSSSGRYHLANPISNDGIHWLAENFIEWKPIE